MLYSFHITAYSTSDAAIPVLATTVHNIKHKFKSGWNYLFGTKATSSLIETWEAFPSCTLDDIIGLQDIKDCFACAIAYAANPEKYAYSYFPLFLIFVVNSENHWIESCLPTLGLWGVPILFD